MMNDEIAYETKALELMIFIGHEMSFGNYIINAPSHMNDFTFITYKINFKEKTIRNCYQSNYIEYSWIKTIKHICLYLESIFTDSAISVIAKRYKHRSEIEKRLRSIERRMQIECVIEELSDKPYLLSLIK